MTITALRNSVLFQFVDAVKTDNQFVKETTASGIVIAGDTFDSSAKTARWIHVIAVGPEVTQVKVGDTALLPALRWTEGMKHNGVKFWKTDENEIVATTSNEDGAKPKPINNWVLFDQNKNGHVRQIGLIAVIGGVNDTPSGTAFAVGPKADKGLAGSTFYYDDTNFTDTTKWVGKEFAFIRDESILVVRED